MCRHLARRQPLARPHAKSGDPTHACGDSLRHQPHEQATALPHGEAPKKTAPLVGECRFYVQYDDALKNHSGNGGKLGDILRNDGRVGLRDDGDVHDRNRRLRPKEFKWLTANKDRCCATRLHFDDVVRVERMNHPESLLAPAELTLER